MNETFLTLLPLLLQASSPLYSETELGRAHAFYRSCIAGNTLRFKSDSRPVSDVVRDIRSKCAGQKRAYEIQIRANLRKDPKYRQSADTTADAWMLKLDKQLEHLVLFIRKESQRR